MRKYGTSGNRRAAWADDTKIAEAGPSSDRTITIGVNMATGVHLGEGSRTRMTELGMVNPKMSVAMAALVERSARSRPPILLIGPGSSPRRSGGPLGEVVGEVAYKPGDRDGRKHQLDR